MYEITITKRVDVTRVERGDYVKVGQVQVGLDSDGLKYHGGLKDKYEYGPDREYTTSEEKQIYKQTVEALDLVSVINAVNGGVKCSQVSQK